MSSVSWEDGRGQNLRRKCWGREDRALKIKTDWGSEKVKLDLWGKNRKLNLGGQIRGGEATELSFSQDSGHRLLMCFSQGSFRGEERAALLFSVFVSTLELTWWVSPFFQVRPWGEEGIVASQSCVPLEDEVPSPGPAHSAGW